MTNFIDNLKNLTKRYKEKVETKDLLLELNAIKLNPICIFCTGITDANDALLILVNIMCHKETTLDYNTFMNLKCSVLDILIEMVNNPEIAWLFDENFGIISTLFDELYKQKESYINIKILKCLESYLKFERDEIIVFGKCQESCCEFGLKRKISQKKVTSASCSIVKICLNEVNNGNVEGIDMALIVLNNLFRNYHLQISPDTCGDVGMYGTFKHFILSVFESTKYSSICAVNALSCLLRCRDSDSKKCFNDTNGKYTLTLIYDILVKSDLMEQSSPCLYAISLLNDMLQQDDLVDLIRRVWTIDHFKTICKKSIGDHPFAYHEMILIFFLAIKDKIPEWTCCLQRFLHTNSKLLTFINSLTLHESNRVSILAWRLLKLYFKPSEVPELFSHEYLTTMTNTIRLNLEKASFADKYEHYPSLLVGRKHLRLTKRAYESCEFFLLLLDSSLSDKLVAICSNSKIVSFFVALSHDLMDRGHNSLLSLQPYATESLTPFLCDSSTWFMSGARLVVSLMFISVSMSQNYPDSICTKTFEPMLISDSLTKLLALCLTCSIDNDLIQRSIALVTFCSRVANYDLSLLSGFMRVNNELLSTTCRSLVPNSAESVDRGLSTLMQSHTSLHDSAHDRKHRETVERIVQSWLTDFKTDLSAPETVLIFEDYIRVLREHEDFLEVSLGEKERQIRHCNDSIDQYRARARTSDSALQRLSSNVRSLHEAVEGKKLEVHDMETRAQDYEGRLNAREGELTKKSDEVAQLTRKLAEVEAKLTRASKDLEGSEELNNELRALLTRSESENKSKEIEIKRLTDITETIENLFHRR